MTKVIVLGSGAATGVPSLSGGWGACDPDNPKNRRQRTGLYVEDRGTKLLIDTSVDLKNQLIANQIKTVNGVLYTHTHADHLHGIDDLRGITRNLHGCLDFYAIEPHIADIKQRFSYAFANIEHQDSTNHPELLPNIIRFGEEFAIGDISVMPLEFSGHTMVTTGYCLNRGQIVVVPDFKFIPPQTMDYLTKISVNLLIMPLTIPWQNTYHADIQIVLHYAKELKAKQVVLTHMAVECDYEKINEMTPENVTPAYDNMTIEL